MAPMKNLKIREASDTAADNVPIRTLIVSDGTLTDNGDGSATVATGGAGGISDGDKGDVTVSSSGTVWTIDNDAVTYAKMQNVSATDKLLGRVSASAGDVEEVAFTDFAQSLLDDANASTARTTLGIGTIATQDASNVSISGGAVTGITDLALADGGTGASLSDPNADRILFWDDSAGQLTWLTPGTGLTITTTTIDASGGNGVAANSFYAHKNSSDQTVSNATFTKATFGTESWDTGGYWDASTSTFQPTVAGKYEIHVVNTWTANGAYRNYVTLYKNGVRNRETITQSSISDSMTAQATFLVDMNGSTDTIEIYCYQNSGGTRTMQGDPLATWIFGKRVE